MSHALLIVAWLVVAQPPVVPELRPTELPADLRRKVLDVVASTTFRLDFDFRVAADGFWDAKDLLPLRAELSATERWLALRPDDATRRVRAAVLAARLGDERLAKHHQAELRRSRLRTAGPPRLLATRPSLLALTAEDDKAVSLAVARQVATVAPNSADAWQAYGFLLALAGRDKGEWRPAFDRAAALAPHDWRVPAGRAGASLLRVVGPPDLSAAGADFRDAVRLGGADPECARWAAETACGLCLRDQTSTAPEIDPQRAADNWMPALERLVEVHPGDARPVAGTLMMELCLRQPASPPGPTPAGTLDLLPSEVRDRYSRWVRQALWAVTVPAPDHADRLYATCCLLHLVGRQDAAATVAERLAELDPARPDRERLVRNLLGAAGRREAVLERCRRGGGDRTPEGVRCQVGSLLKLGRFDEARRIAETAHAADPAEPLYALAVARCRLRDDTPDGRAVADRLLTEVWAKVKDQPLAEPLTQDAGRLLTAAHLLAGRYLDADRLLDHFRVGGHPFLQDETLTEAARPYRWGFGAKNESFIVPAGVR